MPDSDPFSKLPKIREFLAAIAPMLPAYRFGVFSFAALLHNGEKIVLRARLDLCAFRPDPPKRTVATGNLWASQICLQLDPTGIENCIRSAVTGTWLPLADGHLLKLAARQPAAYLQGFNATYERMDQLSLEKLVISGASRNQLLGFRATEVEGEVAEFGFDSLENLMQAYGLRGSDDTALEISAGPVSFISPASQLTGRHARVCFGLAKGAQEDRLRINCRNAEPNTHEVPLVVSGSEASWDERDDHHIAEWEFDLPSYQVIDCRVIYAGRPQARRRLEDPKCLPNPWRTALQLVAPDLSDLEKLLLRPQMKQARDFEIGVAWLFQILGFGSLHVGSVIKKSEGPDDLAIAPDGSVLVIECTVDVPHDSKLMRLISRTARMTELLRAAHHEATVVPMLVTSLPAAELPGIQQKAEKHSILILTRSDLEYAIERSKFAPDPVGLLQHWRHGLPLMRLMTKGFSLD